MRPKTFHLALLVAALALVGSPGEAAAQADTTAAEAPARDDVSASEPFTRRHIDATARRSSRVLLRDWPELTRLLAWTRSLEIAVADEDSTLSAEAVAEFRIRVDSLASDPIPEFLATRRDSVEATFASIRGRLERAEESLGAAPPTVRPEEGAAPNAPDRKRTLVTGKTAVTVPSGVTVGDRDTLPRAAIEGDEPLNYVDLVALALGDLDRLVHLVRTSGRDGISGSPTREAPARPERTAPPPRER